VKISRVRYTPEAANRLRKLHPDVKKDIRSGIEILSSASHSGHALHFELSGLWSYRVRSYRIIYQINEETSTLDILLVGARRNIYEELRKFLLK